ncbi:SUMF1/EgtB/PvdO family nonheme iron enzyme, partial [bacterium]|nr:SUMF1/EgtB/PvdO family nonheme iron enzyme [bacterium]
KIAGTNPSQFNCGNSGNNPVETDSWYDAVEFCNKLSENQGLQPCYTINKTAIDPNNSSEVDNLKWTVTCDFSKNGYRLPTEAEWEFSCRAGTTHEYYWGENSRNDYCWYSANSGEPPAIHEVGTKSQNAFGLFDMCGNVWEWCNDWNGNFTAEERNDPTGPTSGSTRTVRGGSFDEDETSLRSANRDSSDCATLRSPNLGFRVCRLK